eukprot:CAMPEP_0168616384 /NCGR_PEP_ID=MMETSP0449_2-20121227/5001_1 /TAXON_ID=1082188 /ORGANISM="Strombidium rassoulzadegani, Strain ras09" /LENGTH=57 /DNA_ID=CAMNT_0008657171 /DNA_START=493 /DNA_END=666 /DNA_ORIENTATION=-
MTKNVKERMKLQGMESHEAVLKELKHYNEPEASVKARTKLALAKIKEVRDTAAKGSD